MFQKGPHRPGKKTGDREALPSGLWQELELHLQNEGAGRLWPRLEERLATRQLRPRLREGLALKSLPTGDGASYLLSDPLRGRYFRLGEREAFILSLLDGEREVEDIVRVCSGRYGTIPASAVEQFLQDLRTAGLLEEQVGLWQRLSPLGKHGPPILWMFSGAEEKLAALYRRLRFLFHPLIWGILLVLLGGTLALLILHWDTLRADLAYLSSSWWLIPLLLLALYLAMIPVVFTHEVFHALACVHFGGRVSRFGLMVRHVLPAAFADVSDVYSFPPGARTAVFLAGPASTVVWAALAAALWAWTPPASPLHLLGAGVMLLSLLGLVVGLSPVAGYDGSEALSEWLSVPNLHRRALRYCVERLRGRLPQDTSPRERRLFCGYGLAFLAYNIAVIGLVLAGLLLLW